MRRHLTVAITVVVILLLVTIVGWAATYTPPYIPSALDDWSRGRSLGQTPVSVAVDIQPGAQGTVVLAWVDLENRLRIARLGPNGQILSNLTPAVRAKVPREPRFLIGPDDQIHLVWLETSEGRSLVTYSLLSSSFEVRAEPFVVSETGDEAQSPRLAFGPDGNVDLFWSGEAGVYHARLAGDGSLIGETALILPGARRVDIQADQNGLLHLAWLVSESPSIQGIFYATLDPVQGVLSASEEMARVFLRTAQRVESLIVALDSTTGYVLWSVQDLRDVSARAWYAFFPLDMPRLSRISPLALEGGGDPVSLWPVRRQGDKVVFALSATVMTENGPVPQICVVGLKGGQIPEGEVWAALGTPASGSARVQNAWSKQEAVITASDRPSLKPSLTADADGHIHMAWLETAGFGVYRVAYASTAPGVREAYNALTLWDVVDRGFALAMRLFLVVGLTPVLGVFWALVPLVWLAGYHLVTGQETVGSRSAALALGAAGLLELLCTYLVYPYRQLMPLLLQWVLPAATAAAGVLVAWLYLHRREEWSLFGAFFVFALTHGLLQMVVFVAFRW